MANASPDPAATAPLGPPPPFDPELIAPLAAISEILRPGGSGADPEAGDGQGVPGMETLTNEDLERDGAFLVEEWSVPGPADAPKVSLLICRLADAATPVPALYHIHGGGMTVGHNRLGVPELLDLAQELRLAVVSVEYRLAPGTRHPGPVEDCYAGLRWTAEHAEELGIDPARIVVVGGSAGGGLGAAVALQARDRGGPALFGQLLMCPMLDDRNDTPSALQMTGTGVWDRAANEAGWTALLGDARGGDDVSPYAAPARATDLSGLPPAFIDVGSAETFRDEDVDYARRIWRSGGTAELHVWSGAFHGFSDMAPQAAVSRDAREARRRWLRRLLAH
ncbi:alpha/beta hydrolase fold domain-containing protein [Streptomyces antimycoticus]|uniref:alpha/beta hydrolase fold domain-containing protein n=1 Tax=Streptomyces antimycoticus TaxID=68175 RepID=UPI0038641A2C|nr:alpha/beta hydrolase [Streptomyces antimycoticus]